MTEEIRTTAGRPIGARGLKTRSQLLLCLKELLAEHGYHATRVIDVARRARTSPATFYQYFADVDAAVLDLARPVAQEGSDGLIYAEIGSGWGGGRHAAGSTVDAFFAFWREHEVVLRVVDLRAAEEDTRFTEIRRRMLSGLLGHLEYAITARPSSPGATDESRRGRGADGAACRGRRAPRPRVSELTGGTPDAGRTHRPGRVRRNRRRPAADCVTRQDARRARDVRPATRSRCDVVRQPRPRRAGYPPQPSREYRVGRDRQCDRHADRAATGRRRLGQVRTRPGCPSSPGHFGAPPPGRAPLIPLPMGSAKDVRHAAVALSAREAPAGRRRGAAWPAEPAPISGLSAAARLLEVRQRRTSPPRPHCSERGTAMSTMLPEPLLEEHRKRAMELSAAARANLAIHVRSTDELRELGLMLGLIEVDPAGSLVTACPWDFDAGDAAVDGTDRRSDSTSM